MLRRVFCARTYDLLVFLWPMVRRCYLINQYGMYRYVRREYYILVQVYLNNGEYVSYQVPRYS